MDTKELIERYPREPWKWRKEWLEGVIPDSSKRNSRFIYFFALFWNAVSSPVYFQWREIYEKEGIWILLLAALFPLAGIGLIVAAVQAAARNKKFGPSALRLGSSPVALGGDFKGTLELARPFPAEGTGEARLSCMEVDTRGEDTSTRLLWEDSKPIDAATAFQQRIPIHFRLPKECLPTTPPPVPGSSVRIEWQLIVKIPVRGVDYYGVFEIPVFETEQTKTGYSQHEIVEDQLKKTPVALDRIFGVTRTHTSSGIRYAFARARTWGAGVFIFIFGAVFLGGGIFAAIAGASLIFLLSLL
jgi:hypothetical protein